MELKSYLLGLGVQMAEKIADVQQVDQTLRNTKTQRMVPRFSPGCVHSVCNAKNSGAVFSFFIA
jgi:hypothetical protein